MKSRTHPDWYWRAEAAIEREDVACFDVAANIGQIFGNVKHMAWFVRAVAEELGYIDTEASS